MSEPGLSWLNVFPDLKLTQFNYPIKNKHLEECLNSACWKMSELGLSWLNDFPDFKLTQFNYPI